jgi:hypothetical protein
MKLMFPQLVATLASLIVGSALLAPALAEDVALPGFRGGGRLGVMRCAEIG